MHKITIDVPTDVYKALHRFALQDRLTAEEASLLALRDWLTGNGYLDAELALGDDYQRKEALGRQPARRNENPRPTAEEEFAAADVVFPMNDEAKEQWMIAAKDANGEYAHIRWRKWPDSDYPTAEEHEEYWALMSTDDPFEPIAWVPTQYTYDDMTKVYG
ncbi:hypothetical protein ACVCNR_00940 [Aquamicrobium terrae]